jgi:hypothetical protein
MAIVVPEAGARNIFLEGDGFAAQRPMILNEASRS